MTTAVIVEGTLFPDGTLKLDEKPQVIPGRVRVTVESLVSAISPVSAPQAQDEAITVGTPQWDALTQRRAALINKMYSPGEGLTAEEQAEYEKLQELSRAAIDRAFPRPRLEPDELAIVKRALGIKDDVGGK
jgi:hypothetical protein